MYDQVNQNGASCCQAGDKIGILVYQRVQNVTSGCQIEPCGIDFGQSVGIGIRFLLKCRFSVGIRIGFRIEKEVVFPVVFFVYLVFSKKLFLFL
jgi:hypothetical protein